MEKSKWSTVKGYIIYETFYYALEYIKKINDTPSTVVWDDPHDKAKREWELLQNEWKKCMINRNSLIFDKFYIQ